MLTFLSIRNIRIWGLASGIRIVAKGTAGWINGNNFSDIEISGAVRGIEITTADTGTVVGNLFTNVIYQSGDDTTEGVFISDDGSGIKANSFLNLDIWDVSDPDVSISTSGTDSTDNMFIGRFDGTVTAGDNSNFYWNLKTGIIWGDMQIDGGTYLLSLSNRDLETTPIIVASVTSDSANRLVIDASGTINWGSGSAATDTWLDRGGVDILRTGDNFEALRLRANQGTSLVAGDFALHANWGTTASIGTITGTDQRSRATITSAGTGQGANPTVILTFKDGTWTTAPFFVVSRAGGSQPTVQFEVTTITATALTLTFQGTPSASETFILSVVGIG